MDGNINTNWDDVPDTDKLAHVTKTRQVKYVRAIRVTQGSIRGADVSGVFELADQNDPFSMHAEQLRVEVKCLWYQRKPPTSWMHLKIMDSYELIEHYIGPVVSDIGR